MTYYNWYIIKLYITQLTTILYTVGTIKLQLVLYTPDWLHAYVHSDSHLLKT